MTLCQVCNSRPAKIHYTEIVSNNMVAFDLCLECAEEKGIDVQKPGAYGLGDLVAGLIDTTADTDAEKISKVRCPRCGFAYSDFKKVGRFGCPECYEAFSAQLLPMLRHIHGGTHHGGNVPPRHEAEREERRRAAELRRELDEAVRQEDYERAATIRDEIRDLEGKKHV